MLGYNEFTGGYEVLSQPPSPLTAMPDTEIDDHFDTELVRWLERHGLMVKPEVAHRVVDVVAHKNPFHPIRKYLESLSDWDGTRRNGNFLTDHCGVVSSDENPNHYAEAIGRKFLISAVTRVYEPWLQMRSHHCVRGASGRRQIDVGPDVGR